MGIFIEIIVFVTGLCFGSFINMLTYRVAVEYELIRNKKIPLNRIRNQSFTRFWTSSQRSFCDHCGRQLKWYENIPLFSWLLLKGKSSCCQNKLPLLYPIVELIAGILFVIDFHFYYRFLDLNTMGIFLISLIILVFLLFSGSFDWQFMILPDFSTVILTIFALILVLWQQPQAVVWHLAAALGAGGFLLALHIFTKGKGMGMGDIKLAVFMGLLLGGKLVVAAFYIAFIIGAIAGIILMITKKAKKDSEIPFGPYLILGTLAAWWLGGFILSLIPIF